MKYRYLFNNVLLPSSVRTFGVAFFTSRLSPIFDTWNVYSNINVILIKCHFYAYDICFWEIRLLLNIFVLLKYIAVIVLKRIKKNCNFLLYSSYILVRYDSTTTFHCFFESCQIRKRKCANRSEYTQCIETHRIFVNIIRLNDTLINDTLTSTTWM